MTCRELKDHYLALMISLLALAACGLPRAAWAKTFTELPNELQAAVRAARERERRDPAQYVVRANEPNSATARNPMQQLELRFGAGEVGLTSAAAEQSQWAMGLRLARYGRAGQLRPVADAAPTITGNRVEYRRGALLEWYVNEERGVEQGFVMASRPAGKHSALVELEMDVTGLQPEVVDPGRVALRATHGEQALTYGELRVTDARGRELPTHLKVAKASGDRARVRLLVDDAAAAYPVTVDPLIASQQAELTASDGAAYDWFGYSAALSSDGNTALIGADRHSGQGAAYVFVRSGTTWTQQVELTASDGAAGDEFGASAALSSDGNTALIGAYNKTVSGNFAQGAAYVFVRSGTMWTQQAELTASDGAVSDYFGASAALSSDGNTALIGAQGKMVSFEHIDQGAAYVFVRSGTTWTQQAELTASDGAAYDTFGHSAAALSSDGNTALIGAYIKAVSGNDKQGAAYVFVRSGTTWTQQAELTASDGADSDYFGVSAALSSDGNTALVGAGGHSGQGAAYMFMRNGTMWTQQAELTASDGAAPDIFGYSAALSSDGNTALIGARDKMVSSNSYQGAAYVFVRSGTTWTQQVELTASDGAASDYFGVSAALSSDGNTALIGARDKMVSGHQSQGAAYVFVPPLAQGAPCSSNGDCASGFCVDSVCCDSACGAGVTTDCQACSVAAGAAVDGTCTALTGTACDDGNPNTVNDLCTGGLCAGTDLCANVTCTALDQCHVAGTCDHSTGMCSNPPKPDGTNCDDGNANTVGDVCTAGVCAGIDQCVGVTCTALDQCHVAGTCNPATGQCSNPPAPSGTACNDGNACTQTDACDGSGSCVGSNPVVCTPLDQCHGAGTCNPATGQCSSPPAPSGTGCDDGNACTQTDACDGNGTCVGSNPVVCTPLDQCHLAGECDPTSGCSNPVAADGTTCNAGNACPQPDTCQLGTCIATQCVSVPVIAGGTVTTDTQGNGATPTEPVQTAVTSPDAGTIAITETAATGTPPTGFALVGEQVTVSAPAATPDVPLLLVFRIDASRIPPGADQTTIQIFKDGVLVPACTGAPGAASPDPCVSDRQLLAGGDVQITVLTSTASVWTFAVESVCGNGILEFGEQCDDGVANGTVVSCCNAKCQFQANGTACTDRNPCTANDTCSAGTCVSGPATDCDDNNACTADSCDPNIGCQHSITCTGNLLPGGGRAKTDCMQEWLSQAPPTNARRNRLVCTDDDPACDFGATGDKACTFHIAMCFNVSASGSQCSATDVEHVTVMQPGPKPANLADARNRTAIEDALVSLGGRMQGVCRLPRAKAGRFCRQNSECDSAPGKGNGVCSRVVKFGYLSTANACTPFADITVPLRQSRGRLGWAHKTIRLSTRPYARGTASDVDALTLVCLPKR